MENERRSESQMTKERGNFIGWVGKEKNIFNFHFESVQTTKPTFKKIKPSYVKKIQGSLPCYSHFITYELEINGGKLIKIIKVEKSKNEIDRKEVKKFLLLMYKDKKIQEIAGKMVQDLDVLIEKVEQIDVIADHYLIYENVCKLFHNFFQPKEFYMLCQYFDDFGLILQTWEEEGIKLLFEMVKKHPEYMTIFKLRKKYFDNYEGFIDYSYKPLPNWSIEQCKEFAFNNDVPLSDEICNGIQAYNYLTENSSIHYIINDQFEESIPFLTTDTELFYYVGNGKYVDMSTKIAYGQLGKLLLKNRKIITCEFIDQRGLDKEFTEEDKPFIYRHMDQEQYVNLKENRLWQYPARIKLVQEERSEIQFMCCHMWYIEDIVRYLQRIDQTKKTKIIFYGSIKSVACGGAHHWFKDFFNDVEFTSTKEDCNVKIELKDQKFFKETIDLYNLKRDGTDLWEAVYFLCWSKETKKELIDKINLIRFGKTFKGIHSRQHVRDIKEKQYHFVERIANVRDEPIDIIPTELKDREYFYKRTDWNCNRSIFREPIEQADVETISECGRIAHDTVILYLTKNDFERYEGLIEFAIHITINRCIVFVEEDEIQELQDIYGNNI